MGARPLARVIQEHIKKQLADEVLFGKLKKGGTVKVTVEKDSNGKNGLKLEAIPDKKPAKPPKEAATAKKQSDKPAKETAKKPAAVSGSKTGPSGESKDDKTPKPAAPRKARGSAVPKVPRKS